MCLAMREMHVRFPVSGRFPWRRKWQPTPVFLPGKSHGQKSLAGYSSWVCKESDSTEMHAYTQVHFSEGLKGLLGGGLVCRGSTLAGPHRLLRLLSNEELSRALPCTLMGFPHDADGKKSAYNAKATNASRV